MCITACGCLSLTCLFQQPVQESDRDNFGHHWQQPVSMNAHTNKLLLQLFGNTWQVRNFYILHPFLMKTTTAAIDPSDLKKQQGQ